MLFNFNSFLIYCFNAVHKRTGQFVLIFAFTNVGSLLFIYSSHFSINYLNLFELLNQLINFIEYQSFFLLGTIFNPTNISYFKKADLILKALPQKRIFCTQNIENNVENNDEASYNSIKSLLDIISYIFSLDELTTDESASIRETIAVFDIHDFLKRNPQIDDENQRSVLIFFFQKLKKDNLQFENKLNFSSFFIFHKVLCDEDPSLEDLTKFSEDLDKLLKHDDLQEQFNYEYAFFIILNYVMSKLKSTSSKDSKKKDLGLGKLLGKSISFHRKFENYIIPNILDKTKNKNFDFKKQLMTQIEAYKSVFQSPKILFKNYDSILKSTKLDKKEKQERLNNLSSQFISYSSELSRLSGIPDYNNFKKTLLYPYLSKAKVNRLRRRHFYFFNKFLKKKLYSVCTLYFLNRKKALNIINKLFSFDLGFYATFYSLSRSEKKLKFDEINIKSFKLGMKSSILINFQFVLLFVLLPSIVANYFYNIPLFKNDKQGIRRYGWSVFKKFCKPNIWSFLINFEDSCLNLVDKLLSTNKLDFSAFTNNLEVKKGLFRFDSVQLSKFLLLQLLFNSGVLDLSLDENERDLFFFNSVRDDDLDKIYLSFPELADIDNYSQLNGKISFNNFFILIYERNILNYINNINSKKGSTILPFLKNNLNSYLFWFFNLVFNKFIKLFISHILLFDNLVLQKFHINSSKYFIKNYDFFLALIKLSALIIKLPMVVKPEPWNISNANDMDLISTKKAIRISKDKLFSTDIPFIDLFLKVSNIIQSAEMTINKFTADMFTELDVIKKSDDLDSTCLSLILDCIVKINSIFLKVDFNFYYLIRSIFKQIFDLYNDSNRNNFQLEFKNCLTRFIGIFLSNNNFPFLLTLYSKLFGKIHNIFLGVVKNKSYRFFSKALRPYSLYYKIKYCARLRHYTSGLFSRHTGFPKYLLAMCKKTKLQDKSKVVQDVALLKAKEVLGCYLINNYSYLKSFNLDNLNYLELMSQGRITTELYVNICDLFLNKYSESIELCRHPKSGPAFQKKVFEFLNNDVLGESFTDPDTLYPFCIAVFECLSLLLKKNYSTQQFIFLDQTSSGPQILSGLSMQTTMASLTNLIPSFNSNNVVYQKDLYLYFLQTSVHNALLKRKYYLSLFDDDYDKKHFLEPYFYDDIPQDFIKSGINRKKPLEILYKRKNKEFGPYVVKKHVHFYSRNFINLFLNHDSSLNTNILNRRLAKEIYMTHVYGSTPYTKRKYMQSVLQKALPTHNQTNLYRLAIDSTQFICDLLENEPYISLYRFGKLLENLANLIYKSSVLTKSSTKSVAFKNLLGCTLCIYYMKKPNNTYLRFAPNFIQSLDAGLLLLIQTVFYYSYGINLYAVHDSYSVPIFYIKELKQVIAEINFLFYSQVIISHNYLYYRDFIPNRCQRLDSIYQSLFDKKKLILKDKKVPISLQEYEAITNQCADIIKNIKCRVKKNGKPEEIEQLMSLPIFSGRFSPMLDLIVVPNMDSVKLAESLILTLDSYEFLGDLILDYNDLLKSEFNFTPH